jgi:predicted nuclease of predicted toxin-antitoxin system
MRFLVDAQLPPALCRWLEGRGHATMNFSKGSRGHPILAADEPNGKVSHTVRSTPGRSYER